MVGLSSLLALLVIAGGAAVWWVGRDAPYVAPPPAPAAPGVQSAAAAGLLDRLTTAVIDRDPAAAAALAADGDANARRELKALVRNARQLRITDFDLRYIDEYGGVDPDGVWPASVRLTWRFAGFGGPAANDASAEVQVDFAVDDAGAAVGIAGLGGPQGVEPAWWGTRAEVRRGADHLVVAAGSSDPAADRYQRLTRRAIVVVRRVLPQWRDGLVVIVARDARGVDRALGVEPDTFRAVAGVTATADGSEADDVPVHVFLNPAQLDELSPAGRQVVVSHEAAHVALAATSTSLPVWLSEGFADYVALRDVDLPLTTTAAQIIEQVRRDGVPEQLPDDADFDEQSEYFGAAYEAAWLACRMLVDRAGEAAVLRFYRAADGADDVELARLFRESFGLSLAAFTGKWQDRLSELAA